MKFKIGDKVKILPYATSIGVEFEDVDKIGVISRMTSCPGPTYGIQIQMNEVCKVRAKICKWSVGYEMIELCPIKGQQLEFSFMTDGVVRL